VKNLALGRGVRSGTQNAKAWSALSLIKTVFITPSTKLRPKQQTDKGSSTKVSESIDRASTPPGYVISSVGTNLAGRLRLPRPTHAR
jgi:hypothetical protein